MYFSESELTPSDRSRGSGCRGFDAVHQHVHAADAQHGGVEVIAVEHAVVEVAALGGVSEHGGCWSRMYSAAATRKPAVPQAGSQISSVGCGATMSTISPMMWRGCGTGR